MTDAGDIRFFAGWRSDPFFFDVQGALNDLHFTGDDFFTDKDICSIVLEVPNSLSPTKRLACGVARWTAPAENWSRRIAERGQIKPLFLPVSRTPITSLPNRRTTPVSSPSSRTRWCTQAVIRCRNQSESPRLCCPTSFTTIPRVRRPFRTMAVRSATTS